MKNCSERKKINKLRHLMVVLYVQVALGFTILMYVLTQESKAILSGGCGFAITGAITWFIHRLDDRYISSIVSDLSELTDALFTIQKKEIFPENEDTLVSKLQMKVIKLADVLQKKEKKSREEQENIKSLVSDLSHQLKTPISNLKMYSDFLQNEELDVTKRAQYVQILQISVERLYFLSESMIKISRLESGLIRLHPEAQSLNGTVLQAVKQVYVAARKKQVVLRYQEEKEITAFHDRNWTAEAVFNLLDNAVKYAAEATVVSLSIRKLGMYTEITVKDQNDPITESEQARVFARFYRGSNSHKKEGVGVGLYLAREIVIKQGGYMKLGTDEEGNSFSIFLPERKTGR